MALTRAQLLMGDAAQDTVLAGQVQAVKEGDGVTILLDGTIEVNSQTARGVMRLGQTAVYADSAFNGYWWPQTVTAADLDRQITIKSIDGNGYAVLQWSDSDGIDWTQRGQLIAATAAGETNDDLVDIGSARSFLMSQVDNGTLPTGLAYSDVITSSMKVPSGTQGQRPTNPVPGDTRFSTTQNKLEVYGSGVWQTVASEDPAAGSYVRQVKSVNLGPTDVAAIPAGTTAERITNPRNPGYFRYNTTTSFLEYWDSTAWQSLVRNVTGTQGIIISGSPLSNTGNINVTLTINTLPLLP